jgi:glycosyltransferase involved in cell wall biosynthesis
MRVNDAAGVVERMVADGLAITVGKEGASCMPQADAGRRLRVLFINDTSRNGGPGRTILYILKFLDTDRIHRTVLIPREGIVSRRIVDAGAADHLFFEPGLIENLYEPLSRPIKREDFDAPLVLKMFRVTGNVSRGTMGFFRLLRRVRKEHFDLIFCNGTLAGFFGGALAVATGTPAIWHVFYPSVAPLMRPLHRMLAARRDIRLVICVSRPTSLQFEHCAEKVRQVHLALDIDEFDWHATKPLLRNELGLDDRTVVFGSCGRILPQKGFIELIRAARIVIDRLSPDDRARCRFVILGDTPQDAKPNHLEEYQSLARELGLTDYVQFIGFRAEVRPYMADFDISIVPSIYEDPLPLVVMESMAMAKPVVAFDVGGIGEMFEDGVEGRLVRGKPPDIEALAEACLGYFFDPELRRRHGAAARKRVERDFDAGKHARRLQAEMFRIVAAAR